MIFAQYLQNSHNLRNEEEDASALYKKKQKNDQMIFSLAWNMFTDNKRVVLNFSVIGNTVFFVSRSWWKDDIYWLMRSSCFEPFGDGKHGLFFSQKVDGKMIYTWSFWAFHDIPGPGKYGFCKQKTKLRRRLDPQNAYRIEDYDGKLSNKRLSKFRAKWQNAK